MSALPGWTWRTLGSKPLPVRIDTSTRRIEPLQLCKSSRRAPSLQTVYLHCWGWGKASPGPLLEESACPGAKCLLWSFRRSPGFILWRKSQVLRRKRSSRWPRCPLGAGTTCPVLPAPEVGKCLSISYYNKNLPTFERIMWWGGVGLAETFKKPMLSRSWPDSGSEFGYEFSWALIKGN